MSTNTTTLVSPAGDSAEQASLSHLHHRLDQLWIGYLTALDAYTKAQHLLQKHMSAGFLSLARANFNARDGITRHGKDFYHERAIATKRISIHSGPEGNTPSLKLVEWKESPIAEGDAEDVHEPSPDQEPSQKTDDDRHPQQQPSPPPSPNLTAKDTHEENSDKPAESAASEDPGDAQKIPLISKPSLAADPIRWFGILVPRELRSAQTSFRNAIEEPMLDAISAAKSMRDVEVEIRKLRKEMRRAEKAQR